MNESIENVTDSRPANSSAARVRRYRERRKRRLCLLTVPVPETVIEEAVARGLLPAQGRAEPWSVIQSCYAAQISDAALEWLIKAGVIKREQRVIAVEVLRCISRWLEQANA
jgi:hypothetical protein